MDAVHGNETATSKENQLRSPVLASSEKDQFVLGVSRGLSGADEVGLETIDAKEERAFLWRLDLGFLTIGFLGYMFKYLDQINISNAYVSGMQEDLNLTGNELNYFTTYFK